MGRDAAKQFTVLIGCYGDFPHYSVRAMESVASGRNMRQQCDFAVGLNDCCHRTVLRARSLINSGAMDALVEVRRNLNKDPMMRVLLDFVRTPYVLWLDDDSHFRSLAWPMMLADFISSHHPFDVAGQLATWGPRRDLDEGYLQYIRARPWWRGDDHYPMHVRQRVTFPLGGFFLARTKFLRQYDYPDRGMIKGADDVALGELVLQVGARMVPLPREILAIAAINDGDRRGTHFEVEDGWKPSVAPGVPHG